MKMMRQMAAEVECGNCNMIGHLTKICASHIFNTPAGPSKQNKMKHRANMIELGENTSSNDDHKTAQAYDISRRVRKTLPVYKI